MTIPQNNSSQYTPTDTGNAQRLVAGCASSFRYVADLKQWFVWDSRRWTPDSKGAIYETAKLVIQSMLAQAVTSDDPKRCKSILQFLNAPRIRGMVEMAKTERAVVMEREEFNRHPLLLNLENGTLELDTGTLHPHRSEDYLTQLAPVDYKPDALCPRWLQFMEETFSGQPEVIEFLQRAVGYSLTGSIEEQCFWLLIEVGKNGKSVFLNVLERLLGDYAASTSFNTFIERGKQRQAIDPRDGLAALENARFVRASESDKSQVMSEALITNITGGEKVRTARLYQLDYEYLPQFKVWLATNHEPVIKGTDEGIWRRVRRVNFEHVVPEQKRDPALADKLATELSGILNWALAGLKSFQKDGLKVPEPVKTATADYRLGLDVVPRFLAAETISGPGLKVEATALYERYKEWATKNEEYTLKSKSFREEILKHGYQESKSHNPRRYLGLALDMGALRGQRASFDLKVSIENSLKEVICKNQPIPAHRPKSPWDGVDLSTMVVPEIIE